MWLRFGLSRGTKISWLQKVCVDLTPYLIEIHQETYYCRGSQVHQFS